MSMFPGGFRSPLLASEGATTAAAAAGSGGEAPSKPILYTGRQIVAFRRGAAQAGLQTMSNQAGLGGSKIASAGDIPQGAGLASALQDNEAVYLETLDVMVVKDPTRLAGLASVGGDSPIREVSPERFVPMASTGGGQPLSYEELQRAVAEFARAMQQLLQAGGVAPGTGSPGTQGVPSLQGPPVSTAAANVFQDTNTTTWGLQAIGANASALTGRGVKVCIIDSGIDANHPDIQNRAGGLTIRSFVGDAGQDTVGHGTHVAGTACGKRDANSLSYGVAPNAALFVAKVINPMTGLAMDGDILAAIHWAVTNRCQVVNMSLAAPVNRGQPFSGAFEVAAQNALQAGTLLVAAAGNDSRRPGFIAPVCHPANCPSVMAVSAVNPDLTMAPFSCGTVNSDGRVDVTAPGSFIFSSWALNVPKPQAGIQQPQRPGYAFDQGTSMASPHVAGTAALLSEKLGGVGGLALWQALVLGAVRAVPGLAASDVGFGLIQAPQR